MRSLPRAALISCLAVGVPLGTAWAVSADEATVAEYPEMEKADEHVAAIEAVMLQLKKLRKDARRLRNMALLSCVNERLNAVQGLKRIGKRTRRTLSRALLRNDRVVIAQKLSDLITADNQAQDAFSQARACAHRETHDESFEDRESTTSPEVEALDEPGVEPRADGDAATDEFERELGLPGTDPTTDPLPGLGDADADAAAAAEAEATGAGNPIPAISPYR